jgi:hypothetical protein
MGQWQVLAGSKLRETWNHRLRFGRSGIWFILFEMIGLVTIIFWLGSVLPKQVASLELPGVLGFLVAMNLFVGFGNSYNRAEGVLFCNEAFLDRLLAAPRDVVLSAVMVIYIDNLRPAMQAPLLLALILAYNWFPGQVFLLWGLFFILPLFSAAAAVLAVILVKRFISVISGLLIILSALLVLSGMAGAIWLVVNLTKGGLLNVAFFNLPVIQPVSWWPLFFLLAGLITVFIARGLAYLWGEALLLQEEQTVFHLKKDQGQRLMAFLSRLQLPSAVQGIILKEWQSLRRSSITKFRLIAWLILSVVPFLHPGLRSFVTSLPSQLIAVFVIWVFCFGELIAAAYQSEADRLGFLWLAAVKPGQLALGKFLAYLPLALFALGSAGIVVFVSGLRGMPVLLVLLFTFIGAVTSIAFSLAPAALSMNKVFYHSGSISDLVLEQVPAALPSMLSLIALIGFLVAYCYIIVLTQSGGMASLASVGGVLAGGGISAVLAIAVTGFLLKRCYSL